MQLTVDDRLRADLKIAMKDRDRDRMKVLRSVLGAIGNAEAQPVEDHPTSNDSPIAGAALGLGAAEAERRVLTEDDVRRVIAAERDERLRAATRCHPRMRPGYVPRPTSSRRTSAVPESPRPT